MKVIEINEDNYNETVDLIQKFYFIFKTDQGFVIKNKNSIDIRLHEESKPKIGRSTEEEEDIILKNGENFIERLLKENIIVPGKYYFCDKETYIFSSSFLDGSAFSIPSFYYGQNQWELSYMFFLIPIKGISTEVFDLVIDKMEEKRFFIKNVNDIVCISYNIGYGKEKDIFKELKDILREKLSPKAFVSLSFIFNDFGLEII